MLAKISQAKAYKKEKDARLEVAPEIKPVQLASAAQQPQQSLQSQQSSQQPLDAFSASQRQEENQGQPQIQESEPETEVDNNDGRGNNQRAANYLNQAVKTTDKSKGMRMETYSELKERDKRSQKVTSVPRA